MFTSTKEDFFVFICLKFYWSKWSAFMGSIAEGLIIAHATGTPKISFSTFNVYWVRKFLGNFWVHKFLSPGVFLNS
tara:strand:- start:12976 stop:13203 length:228 start_codon:yes stop_codon:yes gene_type:complete